MNPDDLDKGNDRPTDKSSRDDEPVFLAVGKIRRAHGLEGEMLMDVITHFPERLKPGKVVYFGEQHTPLSISQIRWSNKAILVTFTGYENPETVAELRNTYVYVKSDELPELPAGEFYHHQLIGINVLDVKSGEELGVLQEILETGANDVYLVVSEQGTKTLLPAIKEVVLSVDLKNGLMQVCAPDWL